MADAVDDPAVTVAAVAPPLRRARLLSGIRPEDRTIAVVGLPGSGRSTLLRQLLGVVGGPVEVAVPVPGIQAPVRLAGTDPRLAPVAELLDRHQAEAGSDAFIDDAIAALATIEGPLAVAVDLVPALADEARPTFDLWARMLQAGIRCVFAARFIDPLVRVVLQSGGGLHLVGQDALAFTEAEVAAAVLGEGVEAPAWLADLTRRTGGWASMLAAARSLAELKGGPTARDVDLAVGGLADALAARVVGDMPRPDMVAALHRAAAPEVVSVELLAALLPERLADHLMDVATDGMWQPVDPDDPTWLRLQPLLALGLRRSLDASSPGAVAAIRAEVAEWHRQRGDAVLAVETYLAARRWDEARELLLESSLQLAEVGAHATFGRLLDAIPPGTWAGDVELLLHLALFSMTSGDADRAVAILSRSPFTDHDLAPATAAVADALRAFLVLYTGAPQPALEAAERATAVLAQVDEADLPVLTGIRAARPYAHLAGVAAGRAETLLYRWVAAKRRLGALAEDPGVSFLVRLNARASLAWVLALRGELGDAERHATEACATAGAIGVGEHQALADAHLALALVAWWRVDLASARAALGRAEEAARRHHATAQLTAVALIDAELRLLERDPQGALAALAAGPAMTVGSLEAWAGAVRVRALVRADEVPRAVAAARSRTLGPDTVLAAAEASLRGDPEEVGRGSWTVPPWPSGQVLAALAEAIGEVRAGRSPLGALGDAIEAARPERLVAPFAQLPAPLPSLLAGLPAPDTFEQELVRVAAQGGTAVRGGSGPPPPDGSGGAVGVLTEREVDVLRAMAQPHPMAEVAASLFLSPNTLKTHARRIYRKLEVASRSEAVDAARRRGLL